MAAGVVKRPAPYRIKDLVRMTGITKETIHFYITEGLLPRAKKTSKNMAWYGDEHVDRLKTIKELQERQFLPLKAIKAVLTDAKEYAFTPGQQRTLEALQRTMRQKSATKRDMLDLAKVQARYKMTDKDIAELEHSNLLTVDRSGARPQIEAGDEAYFRIWSRLREIGFSEEQGFSPADLEAYENVAALMFDQGVRLITEKIDDFNPEQAERMLDEAVPLVNELVGLFHSKKVREFITNFKAKS